MANLFPRKRDFFDFIPSFFDDQLEDRTPFMNQFGLQNPKVDVKDKGDHYEIDAELPGYSKDDIVVEYKDHYLTIKGHKEESSESKNDQEQFIRRERSYGSFHRSFYIGDIDEKDISGKFDQGILKLTVPKSNDHEDHNSHRINIY
ncbi:Hsp20/alpha crystallin family protein [Aquisalibacillus elongatus]|uniref:Heat shock protein Hsp20 n=1 Tax=Aquisalibacillus elongatus TaxID=485577 RepID=A0A3N5B4H9_9BACI|nr:Hsp20/alpha crystallin family protein [Aquisalibacillus elongatus]RPF52177.1 heat shock protein Hsp20 [Aquisalibacillus elongatus]